jgi:flagellar motor protein MotB
MAKGSRRKDNIKEVGASALDKGWPPSWCVSFADMTTLLMASFILWYSLTAMKLPPELLTIGGHDKIKDSDIAEIQKLKYAEAMENQKIPMEASGGVAAPNREVQIAGIGVSSGKSIQTFKMSKEQEAAIQEIKEMKNIEQEFKDSLASMNMEETVETEAGIGAIIITPRSPFLFGEGRADLKSEGAAILDKIATVLKTIPNYDIRIEGHTDNTPISPFHRYRYPTNWELSYTRAVAIARYLIGRGIPPERLGVAGYGDSKPRAGNDTEEGKTENRRVELYISFVKAPPVVSGSGREESAGAVIPSSPANEKPQPEHTP